jgi:hypothetical protein
VRQISDFREAESGERFVVFGEFDSYFQFQPEQPLLGCSLLCRIHQDASMSTGWSLFVTKLPSIHAVWHPAAA